MDATVPEEGTIQPEATIQEEATVQVEDSIGPEATVQVEDSIGPEATVPEEATVRPLVTIKPEATIPFRLRPNCKTPSPFNPSNINQICTELSIPDPYKHAVVSGDGGHDEVLPIPNLNSKGSSSGGKSYEDNMMVNSLNHSNENMASILNSYGTAKKIEGKTSTPVQYLELNKDACNIVDVFSGSHFCPGYNNYIDSADKSYKNFTDTLKLSKNPLTKKDIVVDNLLIKHNYQTFKFTALLNHDILLYAYTLTLDPSKAIPVPNPLTPQYVKNMNIAVMNLLWINLLKETEAAIKSDSILTLPIKSKTWTYCYTQAIKLLERITFVDIEITYGNINYMKWSIPESAQTYPWGITQGTSASSILQVLKTIISCCIPRSAGASKKNDKTACSTGLKLLINTIAGADNIPYKNEIAASLHAICKFIGDTSHITFGNLIQKAKDAPTIAEKVRTVYTIFGIDATITPETIKKNIEDIKIKFWISERPMATRLCLDKHVVKNYSVGISNVTGQIIKSLYLQPIADDEYLSVDFDPLALSKSIVANTNAIFSDIRNNFSSLMDDSYTRLDSVRAAIDGSMNIIITSMTVSEEEKTQINNAVKDLKADPDLSTLIETYNIAKLKKDKDDALNKISGISSIKKIVDLLEKGATSGSLTKECTDLRRIPKQTSAQGWIDLKKAVLKKGTETTQYENLKNAISLLLSYISLDHVKNTAEVKMTLETRYTHLYWLITNLGNLYQKHSTNIYNIIANAIDQIAKESESTSEFYVDISSLIENVVTLHHYFLERPVVANSEISGGTNPFIQDLIIRGLGSSERGEEVLKTYVLFLLEQNVPIYIDEIDEDNIIRVPKSSIWKRYNEDKEKVAHALHKLAELPEVAELPEGTTICFFGPFKVVKNTEPHIENNEDNDLNDIISNVVEYDTTFIIADEEAMEDLNIKIGIIFDKILMDYKLEEPDKIIIDEKIKKIYMEKIDRNRHIFESQYTSQEDQRVPIASHSTHLASHPVTIAANPVPDFMSHTVPTLSYGTGTYKRRREENVPDIEETIEEEGIEVPTFKRKLKRAKSVYEGGKQFKKHTRKYKKKQNKKTKHRGKKNKKYGTLKKLRYKKHTKRHKK
jgi:hypothetical protein